MIKTVLLLCLGIFNCQEALTVTAPLLKLNDGRDIPCFGLGTALGNNTQGRIQPGTDEVENAVIWALEAGYRHIDTAYTYRTEEQIGRALKKKIDGGMKREDIFVTTKLWNEFHVREAVVPALRKSLTNLGLEYVDLYLIHWPVGQFENKTYDYTDYLDTWRGMMEAKVLGLTKSIGVSNFNERQIDRIIENALEVPAVLQVEPGEVFVGKTSEEGLGWCVISSYARCGTQSKPATACAPLLLQTTQHNCHGFGSLFYSKAKDNAPPPRVDDPMLVAIAENHGKTVTQVVLRYLLDLNIIPIPKSLTRSRIEQNIDVFDFQLTDEEKVTLRAFDTNYRTIPQYKWKDHSYYPF